MPSSPRVAATTVLSAPVTALAPIPGTTLAIAGQANELLLLDLSCTGTSSRQVQRWKVFERERVHRVVPASSGQRTALKAIVLGGREAVLLRISLNHNVEPVLEVLARFQTNDFIGDGAFLDNDHVLLSTLHNSLLAYRLPSSSHSTSSTSSPFSSPLLRPVLTLHAPLRPLLWCARFSRSHYTSCLEEGSVDAQIRLAGGTMWGDAYLWDVDSARAILELVVKAEVEVRQAGEGSGGGREIRREGGLRRYIGHKGSIFTASFPPSPSDNLPPSSFVSPVSSTESATPTHPPCLLTASDDRTLRIFPLPVNFSPSIPLEGDNKPLVIDTAGEEQVLWAHEGRIWRSEWADEEGRRIVSVGEDATLRLWTRTALSPPSASSSSAASTLSTFSLNRTDRSGHDGRSIWSVAPVSLLAGGLGVLTGGADGGVRYWALPPEEASGEEGEQKKNKGNELMLGKGKKADKGGKVKAFAVAAMREGAEVVATVTLDGSFYVFPSPAPSNCSATALPLPSTLAADPIYASPSSPFAGASTAVVLALLPLSGHKSEYRLLALSNRGHVLSADVSLRSAEDGGNVMVRTANVTVHDLPVRVTDVAFLPLPLAAQSEKGNAEPTVRALVWNRASWALSVVDLLPSSDPATTPLLVANLPISTLAPTALHFLSSTLFVVGFADGGIALYSHRNENGLVQIALLGGVHADGVADIASRQTKKGHEETWEVETAGRDGVRAMLLISSSVDHTKAVMEKVDERPVVKGGLEKIFPGPTRRYLGLSDGRAVIFSASGEALYSFTSPGKKNPAQLVLHEQGGMSYYRLVSGQLHVESLPSSPTLPHPYPVILPALHGREVRDVASLLLPDGRKLLAMGAENGVLTISSLSRNNGLRILYTNLHLPAALKSLAWSAIGSSSLSPPSTPSYLLLATGARSHLTAFCVTPTPIEGEEGAGVRVLPAGSVLGEEVCEEGEEIRCMGLTVVGSLEQGREEGLEQATETGVVAVYSDGSVKLWSHTLLPLLSSAASSSSSSVTGRSQRGTFRLVASSAPKEGAKCVLTVEAREVEVERVETHGEKAMEKRMLLVTGSSDGLLALRDVTPFLRPSSTLASAAAQSALDTLDPFFTLRQAHQSGINALAISVSGSTLTIATGGDDNALSIHRVELSLPSASSSSSASSSASASSLQARLCAKSVKIEDAHASTITGLSFLPPSAPSGPSDRPDPSDSSNPSPSLLISTSIDQRLNLWRFSPVPSPSLPSPTLPQRRLDLIDSTCVSVADCAALELLEEDSVERNSGLKRRRKVVVVGIGAEVVEFTV